MKTKTYNFGCVPNAVVLKALDGKPYTMTLCKSDEQVMRNITDQGIDSHLEAIFFKQSREKFGRLELEIEPESMLVLLRRLYEDGSDAAWSLHSDIMQSLDIEEV